jgi:hypothetical protein
MLKAKISIEDWYMEWQNILVDKLQELAAVGRISNKQATDLAVDAIVLTIGHGIKTEMTK